MTNFKILLTLTLVSLLLAVLFFLYPNLITPIPYGSFAFAFTMVTCFWIGARLIGISREAAGTDLGTMLTTLKNFFLVMGAFFFFDGIAHVGIPALYPVDTWASHMHTFSHAIFFVGNALFIRIPVSFINAGWKNAASAFVVIFGIFTVGWRVFNLDKLVYIFGPDAPPIIITDNVTGILFLIINTLTLLIPGLYLIYRGVFGSADALARRRALLLGIGIGTFFSIGPVIDIFPGPYLQLLIHLILATAYFFMGASVLYRAGTVPVTATSNQ